MESYFCCAPVLLPCCFLLRCSGQSLRKETHGSGSVCTCFPADLGETCISADTRTDTIQGDRDD